MRAEKYGPGVLQLTDRLFRIDTFMFGWPGVTSVYVVKGERAALIDSGVSVTADAVLDGIAAAGVRLEDLAFICLTHAHYDHAGGAHELLRRLKSAGANVKVACAQKPSIYLARQDILDKIIVAGRAAEGDWAGVMKPIEPQDVLVLKPGDLLDLGGTALEVLDAPGHANGHLAFLALPGNVVFAGEACGVCGFTDSPRPIIAPAAFAPEYRHKSYIDTVRVISELGAVHVALAHFGLLTHPRPALLESIEIAENIHGRVRQVIEGRGDRDRVIAFMAERLAGSLLPIFKSNQKVLITIESLFAGMAHDLKRSAAK